MYYFSLLCISNAFAQDINNENLLYIPKDSKLIKTFHIPIEGYPISIGFKNDNLYLASNNSDGISIISTKNYTKLDNDILIGEGPKHIFTDDYLQNVYVANEYTNSITIIDSKNNVKIGDDISVGKRPTSMVYSWDYHRLFVVNEGSNTVSMIALKNNTKIGKDIYAGNLPRSPVINSVTNNLYLANPEYDTLSVIDVSEGKNIANISLWDGAWYGPVYRPSSMDFYIHYPKLYVANYNNNTVSVINVRNNTVDYYIPVGIKPISLSIDEKNQKVYVVNEGSNTISVIYMVNNTKMDKDIPVGIKPISLSIDEKNQKVYVVNEGSNTISVIDSKSSKKLGKDIPVGDGPSSVAFNEANNAMYVTNKDSQSLSVVDRVTDKVVGRFSFSINPSNSGYIQCGNITVPLQRDFYLDSGINCKAIPNKGFEFLSWEENMHSNATRLINTSKPATAIESFLDLLNLKPEEPESTLKVSTFGTFTANFKELPPPLPAEYWATLFGFIITTGLGVWLIPSLVRWTRAKSDIRKSDYYYRKIKSLYNDGSLDENDLKGLDDLKQNITDAYSKGKINELHFNNLKNEISTSYHEIFQKGIKSLSSNNDGLQEIKSSIKDAYSKGKLTELHYNLLNEEISQREGDTSK